MTVCTADESPCSEQEVKCTRLQFLTLNLLTCHIKAVRWEMGEVVGLIRAMSKKKSHIWNISEMCDHWVCMLSVIHYSHSVGKV